MNNYLSEPRYKINKTKLEKYCEENNIPRWRDINMKKKKK